MKRALLSVTNKAGISQFATALAELGVEIISTGGTATALRNAGVPVTLVETVTDFPEMLDGRVKTLHPKIFGGILADRSKPEHMDAIAEHDIAPIDIVVVNLYDFDGKPGIEQIDIGGPSLLRAAAKNAHSVVVIVDPGDYSTVLEHLRTKGEVAEQYRGGLAMKVFDHTSAYDSAIATWMNMKLNQGEDFLKSTGSH